MIHHIIMFVIIPPWKVPRGLFKMKDTLEKC